MELFDVIREIGLKINIIIEFTGLLSTSDSKFYIGSMILAIEYLHN